MQTTQKKWFICQGCVETITHKENFSKDSKLCIGCYYMNQAIEKNECLICKGNNPSIMYWGKCKRCFNKRESEEVHI